MELNPTAEGLTIQAYDKPVDVELPPHTDTKAFALRLKASILFILLNEGPRMDTEGDDPGRTTIVLLPWPHRFIKLHRVAVKVYE